MHQGFFYGSGVKRVVAQCRQAVAAIGFESQLDVGPIKSPHVITTCGQALEGNFEAWAMCSHLHIHHIGIGLHQAVAHMQRGLKADL